MKMTFVVIVSLPIVHVYLLQYSDKIKTDLNWKLDFNLLMCCLGDRVFGAGGDTGFSVQGKTSTTGVGGAKHKHTILPSFLLKAWNRENLDHGVGGWGGGEHWNVSCIRQWVLSRLIDRGDLDLSFSFKKCWHKKKSIYWTGANTGFPRRRSVYCKTVGGPGCMKMKIGLSKGSIHTERKRKKSKKQLQTSWTDFAFASTFASV